VSWLRGLSIRSRITLWSVLIAIVFIAVAAFAFRAGVDTIVAASTHDLLASDGASYEASILRENTANFPKPGEDQLLAVVDPTGAVRISNLPASLAKRVNSLARLPHGVHTIETSPSIQYDVASEPVMTKAGVWHIVEARNRTEGAVVLGGLDTVMVIGGVALVIGFGVSSWLITGIALRPVGRMRRQASLLSQSASAGILPVGPVRDELSALAETLNEFITSVRASTDRERQMVADASHELRSPLAVLTTQLQLAHLSSGDAVALEREISAAEQTLHRLANLATNLLTLSRIEAADVLPDARGDALLAEFLGCLDRAVVLGSAVAVSVDFTTADLTADFTVPIQPADFAGLVDNLVSNAIAASPRGAQVDAHLARRGERLVLTVTDSGHGIAEDFLPVAFDRFSRAEASRTASGNGLGLAIVRATVQRSGGDVRLERRPRGGVLATAELPVHPS
jgi:two-component system OmpR family sensor kinase